MIIGKIISEIREKKGLKQSDMAMAAGVKLETMAAIEKDERLPTQSNLLKIAEFLDTPIDLILMLSVSDDEIQEEKKEAFNKLQPLVKAVLNSVLDQYIK